MLKSSLYLLTNFYRLNNPLKIPRHSDYVWQVQLDNLVLHGIKAIVRVYIYLRSLLCISAYGNFHKSV
jgi:hypothetical protein